MRVLGVDYGDKHTGLALGENGNTMPIETISTTNTDYLVTQISQLISKEHIDSIVIGMPNHKNKKQAKKVSNFITQLKGVVDIDVLEVDETNTSKEAYSENITKHSDIKKFKQKSHSRSAEKILERYFIEKNSSSYS